MFGLIRERYPEVKQSGFKNLKYSLKEPDGIFGLLLFLGFALLGFLSKDMGWLGGGVVMYFSIYYLLQAAYMRELKENKIQINPPEQWKIEEVQ